MVSVYSIFRFLLNVLYTFTEFQIFRSREKLFTRWEQIIYSILIIFMLIANRIFFYMQKMEKRKKASKI